MLYLSAVFSQANLSAAIKQTERIKVCTASSFSLSSEAAQEQRTAELKLQLHAFLPRNIWLSSMFLLVLHWSLFIVCAFSSKHVSFISVHVFPFVIEPDFVQMYAYSSYFCPCPFSKNQHVTVLFFFK